MDTAQHNCIKELYYEMFDMLMAYARSALGNESLAEEAVQETFRVACQRPEQVCESVNPRGWLVQTLKYVIRNIRSSQLSARRLLEKYMETRGQEASFSEDHLDLHILYENVADTEEFKLLTEMVIEGRSHLEMAESRGISVDACKKRAQRAREKLRTKIKL